MTNLPINDATTFGDATHDGSVLTALNLLDEAPAPDSTRPRPAVKRVLSADGANLILFSFTPGQDLPDHKAAHPITVQVLHGSVTFSCGEQEEPLTPGRIVHLPAYAPHAVACRDEPALMLLTMLTPNTGPNV
ncbi:cupin domain-containing protein [Corynebacterium minutissimum]|uniref:Cupin domain-containing protein n=1 Tax=Corynebacterium minutissimum TaxID=38301 RepID=A0A2X4RC61_9CORY|nr:cupin domain-containing protein [Corynebacterium minutissimum]KHO29067.1 LuxR family transcriptional regulator [Corynebacterium minutissimum]QPS59213.1 cupin domain-containing protein [Corynebacterium minutissimum]QQA79998.1 cupin domain-containing protein [Corynebacterium minutissimum]SQH99579.1 double-stranded beta-helix domain [Corynebacterium minutissimum]VEG06325.1 double-stranded beta-helix domain [Corynebacterium minutissimum]